MGYTYVMSDIHGMGTLFEQMLEKIAFGSADRLYILGDMIDRGPDPDKVLDLVMSHRNIHALKGNHEDGFVEWYDRIYDKSQQKYYYNTYDVLMKKYTREKIQKYVEFMRFLPLYKKLRMEDTCYLMAHASTEEILRVWKRKERILWDSSMTDRKKGIPGYVSIVGHVPTFIIRGYPEGKPASIWHSEDGTLIAVDCGAVFPECKGRLGCICLETREEFYI